MRLIRWWREQQAKRRQYFWYREFRYQNVVVTNTHAAISVALTLWAFRLYVQFKYAGRTHEFEAFRVSWWPGSQYHLYWWRLAFHLRNPLHPFEDDE